MERVAIVVLNWNGLADTKRCVASLLEQTYKKYELFIVDNGSSEKGTDKYLSSFESQKNITVLRNEKNKGFTGGVNLAARKILKLNFDYIALFNNDAVADKNWLKELVSASKEQASSITTGLLLHADKKTIDGTGDFYSKWGLPFPRDRNQPTSEASASGEVFSGSGGATLYSTVMLEDIGLFDEKFFAYYEDTDLGFRSQLLGYTTYYTNKAKAYHKRGATSENVPGLAIRHTFKNLPLLYIKNVPGRLLLGVGMRFWLAYLLLLGNAVKNGNTIPAMQGFLQAIILIPTHAALERVSIQRRRTTPVSVIKNKLHADLPPDQTGLRKFRSFFTSNV